MPTPAKTELQKAHDKIDKLGDELRKVRAQTGDVIALNVELDVKREIIAAAATHASGLEKQVEALTATVQSLRWDQVEK